MRREDLFYSAEHTQTRDFRGRGSEVSGPWNVAKTKPSPPPKHTTTSCLRGGERRRGEGVQGHCASDFTVPHASVRSGVVYPSTGEKKI